MKKLFSAKSWQGYGKPKAQSSKSNLAINATYHFSLVHMVFQGETLPPPLIWFTKPPEVHSAYLLFHYPTCVLA